jgi:hypothetical protein
MAVSEFPNIVVATTLNILVALLSPAAATVSPVSTPSVISCPTRQGERPRHNRHATRPGNCLSLCAEKLFPYANKHRDSNNTRARKRNPTLCR